MCGIISVIDRKKNPMDGTAVREALSIMNERGNGEGAGYAVYGAFPEFADYYAIHVFYDDLIGPKTAVEEELQKVGFVKHDEEIPTFEQPNLKKRHIPWRYFFQPNVSALGTTASEEDILVYLMKKVNTTIPGALIYSTGKNIAIFKAAGWPEDILSAWCFWWYGGSYGNRAFIDFYALFAIPIAASLHYAFRKRWSMIAALVISGVFLFHNYFQIQQYRNRAIHFVSMTKEAYWESFGRRWPSDKYWSMLEYPDYEGVRAKVAEKKSRKEKKKNAPE